ncbi:thioesterase family protein [Verminephrobacter eiseniae]|uniref:thioesterase family protein n=1 Tax=Verminephrobacter eiseniae TaxID=364317 RepID=UPI0010D58B14|nr:thioesterase family protein [Verminephrobacter eiseniae]KAB7559872.1 thioesterase [Verminephrobacter sp. Larva24]MCW5231757.1 thioesterase [Verminephrobacter eiseniae]MCW5293489.1 thioesterase [Verminephrobacter eiseniae]MCW8187068.1 thioesterase [Verminephrobacter eiseniae]MCW8225553.1 thioesterase [Verminephrobacter eiseniae]
MTDATPLTIYRCAVRPEWVDYNGHMRDAFYLLIFSFATDALLDRIGLGDSVRTARKRSVYTLEAHINYLREVKQGMRVRVDVRLLASDAKRLHLYLEMHADDADGVDAPVSVSEQMLLHVDTRGGAKSVPFDADVAGQVAALHATQRDGPPPAYAGRVIGLPVRR